MSAYRFPIPASFFGMVLGLAGLGNCWRTAARLWGVPGAVGETIMLITVASWALLLLAYLGKWIWARPQALAEFRHPVQCCFIGLVPVSTLLIALAIAPYAHEAAQTLFTMGAVGQLIFGIHRAGTLWMGDRDPAIPQPLLICRQSRAVSSRRLSPPPSVVLLWESCSLAPACFPGSRSSQWCSVASSKSLPCRLPCDRPWESTLRPR